MEQFMKQSKRGCLLFAPPTMFFVLAIPASAAVWHCFPSDERQRHRTRLAFQRCCAADSLSRAQSSTSPIAVTNCTNCYVDYYSSNGCILLLFKNVIYISGKLQGGGESTFLKQWLLVLLFKKAVSEKTRTCVDDAMFSL